MMAEPRVGRGGVQDKGQQAVHLLVAADACLITCCSLPSRASTAQKAITAQWGICIS
jgi:hypothetical protein